MKIVMKVDFNEQIRKGDAPPKGREAQFVRIGLAEEVKSVAAKSASVTDAAPAKEKAAAGK